MADILLPNLTPPLSRSLFSQLWVTTLILLVTLVFGGLAQTLWNARLVRYHSIGHEVLWSLVTCSYFLAHTSILLMLSTQNTKPRRSTHHGSSGSNKAGSNIALRLLRGNKSSASSLSSVRHSVNDVEGSAPFECPVTYDDEFTDNEDDDSEWADPFGSLPKRERCPVDARPLLSDHSG
jgi:hypothetical protein